MNYKYCKYRIITNAVKNSRFTIGIVIGIALMLGLIILIPDKIFVFILPVIGGFAAGIISPNESITITNTNNDRKEIFAGEAAGIIFGIIICFVGTLLFEWTDLTDMAYLLISPYGENSHIFSLLFIASILILSYFSWKAIVIFSLITVCFFTYPPPHSIFSIIYSAVFDILLANTLIMGLICGVLGSSGNKLSKKFLDCLQNLYYTITNVNFIKRVLHTLSNKFIKTLFFIIFVILVITSTTIFVFSLIEQKEKTEVLPLNVTNVKINTPKIEYYSIPLLKKYATEIALEDYPNMDREFIINLVGKSASLSTTNLNCTLNIYNPNNKTIKLDRLDYALYEIIPDLFIAPPEDSPLHQYIKSDTFTRYIKSDTLREKSITLPPHTTTSVFLNLKLGILQSSILRLDAIMFYYKGVSNYHGFSQS